MKANRTASGIIAKIESHEPQISIITVIKTEFKVANDAENEDGNDESIESISLANRLIILPIGVVSKKAIGARNTPCRMDECNVLLAAQAARYTNNCRVKLAVPRKYELVIKN